jgi:hypothetical protein
MLSVFRDKSASRRDRMEAAGWLTDRAYGRAAQTLRQEVEVPAGVSFADSAAKSKWAEHVGPAPAHHEVDQLLSGRRGKAHALEGMSRGYVDVRQRP